MRLQLENVFVGRDLMSVDFKNVVALRVFNDKQTCSVLYRTGEGIREQIIMLDEDALKELEKMAKDIPQKKKAKEPEGSLPIYTPQREAIACGMHKGEDRYSLYIIGEQPAYISRTKENLYLEYGDHTLGVYLGEWKEKQRNDFIKSL